MPQDLDSLILQLYARTPAPCRDYCGLTITSTDVILNIWNITHGPHVYPRRHTCSLENFELDKYSQMEVKRVFGEHVFAYVMSLSRDEVNLQNLPTKVFLRVLKYLATKDIVKLSQTSKIMFERCEVDNVWNVLFRKVMKRNPDRQDKIIADGCGWKETLRQKMILRGHKIERTSLSGKNNVIKNGVQKRVTFVPESIINNINKQRDTKLNVAKSTSVLATTKTPQKNVKKMEQFKSVVNLNKTNAITRSFSLTKNELKNNNITMPVKNTNLKGPTNNLEKTINVKPINYLEKSINVKKINSANLKPAVSNSLSRNNSATTKNKPMFKK